MLNSNLLKNRLKSIRMQTQLCWGGYLKIFDYFAFRRNRLTSLARH